MFWHGASFPHHGRTLPNSDKCDNRAASFFNLKGAETNELQLSPLSLFGPRGAVVTSPLIVG
jgi:hypothetical protein